MHKMLVLLTSSCSFSQTNPYQELLVFSKRATRSIKYYCFWTIWWHYNVGFDSKCSKNTESSRRKAVEITRLSLSSSRSRKLVYYQHDNCVYGVSHHFYVFVKRARQPQYSTEFQKIPLRTCFGLAYRQNSRLWSFKKSKNTI